ncbi:hypothetical protein HNQ56_004156 [Anaerotaenia torta]
MLWVIGNTAMSEEKRYWERRAEGLEKVRTGND